MNTAETIRTFAMSIKLKHSMHTSKWAMAVL